MKNIVNTTIVGAVFAALVASAVMLYTTSGAKSAPFDKAACATMKVELSKAGTKEAVAAFLVKHTGATSADASALVGKTSVAAIKKQLGEELAENCK